MSEESKKIEQEAKSTELSEQDLDNVAGGGGASVPAPTTMMRKAGSAAGNNNDNNTETKRG